MPSTSTPQPPLPDSTDRLPPAQLAARCQHTQPDRSHEPFCFELFRRAIVTNCSLCWHYVHQHYYSLVRYWVCRRTSVDANTVDDLVQNAFVAFWRAFTADKLDRASGLAAVLNYLKSCAVTAVIEVHRRKERRPVDTEWDEEIIDRQTSFSSAEASALEQETAQLLWRSVEETCHDDGERVVARLFFLADLKPGDIAARHPDLFPDVADVYRVKRNLTDRLRRHPVLQAMHQNAQGARLI
ncbi:MAG: sigma-70 family RNA polymerase sigma factor [Anaerolineae bacterium]|nr:sigma-70 family RNA polymerase sigma factor [Anaerolineae bacterium]